MGAPLLLPKCLNCHKINGRFEKFILIRKLHIFFCRYALVGNSPEERKMFRVTPMHYVIFDEAHMLKNMNTQRYENLIRINVRHEISLRDGRVNGVISGKTSDTADGNPPAEQPPRTHVAVDFRDAEDVRGKDRRSEKSLPEDFCR